MAIKKALLAMLRVSPVFVCGNNSRFFKVVSFGDKRDSQLARGIGTAEFYRRNVFAS